MKKRPDGVIVSTLGSQSRCSGFEYQAGEDKIDLSF